MAALSIIASAFSVGWSIHLAGKKKEDYDKAATDATNAVAHVNKTMEQGEENIAQMKVYQTTYAKLINDFLREEGYACSVTRRNVKKATIELHKAWKDVEVTNAKILAEKGAPRTVYDALKEVPMYAPDPALLYKTVVGSYPGAGEWVAEWIRADGGDTGEWGEWRSQGECQVRMETYLCTTPSDTFCLPLTIQNEAVNGDLNFL